MFPCLSLSLSAALGRREEARPWTCRQKGHWVLENQSWNLESTAGKRVRTSPSLL